MLLGWSERIFEFTFLLQNGKISWIHALQYQYLSLILRSSLSKSLIDLNFIWIHLLDWSHDNALSRAFTVISQNGKLLLIIYYKKSKIWNFVCCQIALYVYLNKNLKKSYRSSLYLLLFLRSILSLFINFINGYRVEYFIGANN